MKRITLQILACMSLLTTQVYAQTASWVWAKALPYSNTNQTVIRSTVDKKGNTYIITYSNGGNLIYPNGTITASQVFILSKIDATGAIKWGKQLPFTVVDDEINALEVNSKSEIYFTFTHKKTCFNVKPDKCFSTMGGFKVTAGTNLIKADSNGNLKYVKALITRTFGGHTAYIQQLVPKGDSQLVVIGKGETVTDFNNINLAGIIPSGTLSNYYIGLVDSSGTGISAKFISSSVEDFPHSITSAVIDKSGNLYLACRVSLSNFLKGTFSIANYPFTAKNDYWSFIAKVNSKYEFEWLNYMRGTKRNSELRSFSINKLAIDNTGENIYAAGNAMDTAIYAGSSIIATTGKGLDGFLLALNANDGLVKWSKTYSNTWNDDAYDVGVDELDNPIVLHNDEYSTNSIIRYTKEGNSNGSLTAGGNYTNIYPLKSGKIVYAGSFIKRNTIGNFQIGSNTNPNITIPMVAMGQMEPSIPSAIISELYVNEVSLAFPNPTSDKLFLNSNSSYVIFNALGLEVKNGISTGNTIDVSQLDNGVYYLQLSGNDKISRMKFIKQ